MYAALGFLAAAAVVALDLLDVRRGDFISTCERLLYRIEIVFETDIDV